MRRASRPAIRPILKKKIRNQEILLLVASGASKETVREKFGLSRSQLDKIVKEASEEAEKWFESLPRQAMIQIFSLSCEKIVQEIQRLEEIRNKMTESTKQFEMGRQIINAYCQLTKLVAEGPTLIRQKEIIEAAEKMGTNSK